MRICTIDDCPNERKTGPYCEKHRSRFRAHGDPNVVLIDNTPAAERWKKLYTIDPKTNCWNWTGPKSRGYGVISNGAGVQHSAHRFVWEQTGRPLIEGMELDHLCRNKGCVNPRHLDQVTHTINVRRGDAGIANALKTHCVNGHGFTEENTAYNAKRQRSCRECTRITTRNIQERRREQGIKTPPSKTHCKHGHAMTEENTFYSAAGYSQCRSCQRRAAREANRRSRARRKANPE